VSSCLLSKNVKAKIYRAIILSVVLYGYEPSSLTLRKEHRLRVYDNTKLRRIFRPKKEKVRGGWKKCTVRSFITYFSPNIIMFIKENKMGRQTEYREDEKCI